MGRAVHTVQGTYIQVQAVRVVLTVLRALQQIKIMGNQVMLDLIITHLRFLKTIRLGIV